MPYAILRFKKMKGGSGGAIEAHHERTKDSYASNPDIDPARINQNYHIIKPPGRYMQEVSQRIEAAGCKVRKDSVKYVDTLITSGTEFFQGKTPEEVKAYFEWAIEYMAQRVGRENIFSAVVHMDEKTPHLHLCWVPLTPDKRLSAYQLLGNRAKLCQWQDEFYQHMAKRFPELQRGDPAAITGRKHLSVQLYKRATKLDAQREQIETLLDSITPFNVKGKQKDLAHLLTQWLPEALQYTEQVAAMEQQKNELNGQIAALEQAYAAKDAQYYDKQLELLALRGQHKKLASTGEYNRKLVEALPKEMLEDLKRQNPELRKLLKAVTLNKGGY